VLADKVTVAERVTVLTHTNVGYRDHPLQKRFPAMEKPVSFGSGSFVGACATILPGVRIGECAFVAAGSLLTKDAPSHCLVGGVPARVLRTYARPR
jgi:maltose O-acetyltransferase